MKLQSQAALDAHLLAAHGIVRNAVGNSTPRSNLRPRRSRGGQGSGSASVGNSVNCNNTGGSQGSGPAGNNNSSRCSSISSSSAVAPALAGHSSAPRPKTYAAAAAAASASSAADASAAFNAELAKLNSEFSKKLAAKQVELDDLAAKIDALQADLNQAGERSKRDAAARKSEGDKRDKELKDARAEADTARSQQEQLRKRIKELEAERRVTDSKLADAEKSAQSLATKHSDEERRLRDRLRDAESRAETAEKKTSELELDVDNEHQAAEAAKLELKTLRESTSKSVEAAVAEATKSRASKSAAEKEKLELRQQVTALTLERDTFRRQFEASCAIVEQLKEEKKASDLHRERERSELSSRYIAMSAYESLSSELQELRQSNSKLVGEATKFRVAAQEVGNLRHDIDMLRLERDALAKQLQSQRQLAIESRAHSETLQSSLQHASSALAQESAARLQDRALSESREVETAMRAGVNAAQAATARQQLLMMERVADSHRTTAEGAMISVKQLEGHMGQQFDLALKDLVSHHNNTHQLLEQVSAQQRQAITMSADAAAQQATANRATVQAMEAVKYARAERRALLEARKTVQKELFRLLAPFIDVSGANNGRPLGIEDVRKATTELHSFAEQRLNELNSNEQATLAEKKDVAELLHTVADVTDHVAAYAQRNLNVDPATIIPTNPDVIRGHAPIIEEPDDDDRNDKRRRALRARVAGHFVHLPAKVEEVFEAEMPVSISLN